MRAFNQPAAGEQPVISELPTPQAAPGTVLVRVHAAALGGTDAGIAAGMMAQFLPHEYPLTLGRDAAGVVESVGQGVNHLQAGDAVVGHVPLTPPIQVGTIAEYVVLPAETVARKPLGISFVDAAALPLAGSAALAVVDSIAPRSGDVVLVSGASGGVGSYVVQLLAAVGAEVVATGAPSDADRLTALGAFRVLDYTGGSIEAQVNAQYPDGVDALLDLVFLPQGPPLALVKKGGRVASLLNALTDESLAAAGITGTNVWAAPTQQLIEQLLEQVITGALRIDVTQEVPLERAGDALAQIGGGGARGKLVVTIT